jgi:hypothetical protein
MSRCTLASLVALFALAGCGDLDTIDQVHDLRILAVRAEPPEEIVAPPSGTNPGLPPTPVVVTGLIADPEGGGRSVHYQFTTCAATDTQTGRCEQTSPDYTVLGEGDQVPSDLGGEVQITFTPSQQLLEDLLKNDPYQGFGGMLLVVQLDIQAGQEKVVAFKRVVFTLPLPGYPMPVANTNPVLSGVKFDGQDWADGTSATLARVDGGAPMQPEYDPSLEESYERPTFDGSSVQFKEVWQFDFFASEGTFDPTTAGGIDYTGVTGPSQTFWTAAPDAGEQDVTFWVVVRDGRGGENWIVRRGHDPGR